MNQTAVKHCRKSILGICVVSCDDEGTRKEVWVDLKKVDALAWCDQEIKRRPGNPPRSNQKIPSVKPPGDCPKGSPVPPLTSDGPMCWYDGRDWVCGEE